MIDPQNITNFNSTKFQLQEVLLFWIAAAGKNAMTTARALDKFLKNGRKETGKKMPFDIVKNYNLEELATKLKACGFGCYNLKARSYIELVNSKFELTNVTIEELETIPGIGMKTARCFVMHSRSNARCAGLDVHILRYMKKAGYKVPNSTPAKKKYLEIEKQFLELADKEAPNVPIAEYDLRIWKEGSAHFMG